MRPRRWILKSIWVQKSRRTQFPSAGGIYCCFSQIPLQTRRPWLITPATSLHHSSYRLDFFKWENMTQESMRRIKCSRLIAVKALAITSGFPAFPKVQKYTH